MVWVYYYQSTCGVTMYGMGVLLSKYLWCHYVWYGCTTINVPVVSLRMVWVYYHQRTCGVTMYVWVYYYQSTCGVTMYGMGVLLSKYLWCHYVWYGCTIINVPVVSLCMVWVYYHQRTCGVTMYGMDVLPSTYLWCHYVWYGCTTINVPVVSLRMVWVYYHQRTCGVTMYGMDVLPSMYLWRHCTRWTPCTADRRDRVLSVHAVKPLTPDPESVWAAGHHGPSAGNAGIKSKHPDTGTREDKQLGVVLLLFRNFPLSASSFGDTLIRAS